MDFTARILAESVLKLLVRDGLIDRDAVLGIADEQDLLAERHPREAEARKHAAHLLRVALLELDPPPEIDPQVQFEADFRRRQMVERTAMLAKERGE